MTAEQLTLTPVHHRDPETSAQAAAKVNAKAQFDRVLRALYDFPDGLTDDELASLLGLLRNSAGTRRGKARDLGLVEAAGTRENERGNRSTVWVLNARGREFVEQGRAA